MQIARPLIALTAAALLPGCDQDPFGLACRTIAGDYCLLQWEDGYTFYIDSRSGAHQHLSGGVIDGTVPAISWNEHSIVVLRNSTFAGDGKGYVAIDVPSGRLIGPAPSIAALHLKDAPAMVPIAPKAAWDKLGR